MSRVLHESELHYYSANRTYVVPFAKFASEPSLYSDIMNGNAISVEIGAKVYVFQFLNKYLNSDKTIMSIHYANNETKLRLVFTDS